MSSQTITRPSADVAVRALRDQLAVIDVTIGQLPKGALRQTLICCQRTYADAIQHLDAGAPVATYAAATHGALHVAIAIQQECCAIALADLLTALGGWSHHGAGEAR